jgi:hypothetical protein
MTINDDANELAALQIGSRIGDIITELEDTIRHSDQYGDPAAATALRSVFVGILDGKEPIDAAIAGIDAWDTAAAARTAQHERFIQQHAAEATEQAALNADPDARTEVFHRFARALWDLRCSLPGRLWDQDLTITADRYKVTITLAEDRYEFDVEQDRLERFAVEPSAPTCRLTDDLGNPCTEPAGVGDLCNEHLTEVLEALTHSLRYPKP